MPDLHAEFNDALFTFALFVIMLSTWPAISRERRGKHRPLFKNTYTELSFCILYITVSAKSARLTFLRIIYRFDYRYEQRVISRFQNRIDKLLRNRSNFIKLLENFLLRVSLCGFFPSLINALLNNLAVPKFRSRNPPAPVCFSMT